MRYPRSGNRSGKIIALGKTGAIAAAISVLPVLAYFGKNQDGNNQQENNKHQDAHSVPDGGPGIVLLTTAIGAILLFGAHQRSRAKT